jgi:hypothetical protein
MYQDFTTPMFPEPAYEQNGHRDSKCFLISSVIFPACKYIGLISFIIQLKGLTGAPENNFSLLGRCCALERVL